MSAGPALAVALTFVWLGMVLGISFVETPLKFRAPGVSIPIGLGIGRLVFRALNAIESALAVGLVVLLAVVGHASPWVGLALAAVPLAAQVLLVRPLLSRRTDRVLAGEQAPRSRAHYAYVGLELVKVAGLVTLGTLLLTT